MPDSRTVTDFAPTAPLPVEADGGDPTAVMGRRIVAWILDLAIFLAVVGSVFAGLADYVEIPDGFVLDACEELQRRYGDEASGCVEIGDRAYVTSAGDNGIQSLVSLGYFAFFVVLQGRVGASPGKLLTGIRVVDEYGRRPGIGRSLVRTLMWVVDGAPWFAPLVGFISGLTSTGHRRVGDLAARTFVVSRKDVGRPPLPGAGAAPSEWGPAPGVPSGATPPPEWDPVRGTYLQWEPTAQRWLQWDAGGNRWMQWDAGEQRWRPLDT